jgi:hypothetical protein
MRTPWGQADRVQEVGPGVTFVTTPSHGGFHLDAARNARVPRAWRDATWSGQGLRGWYEEDCDAVRRR